MTDTGKEIIIEGVDTRELYGAKECYLQQIVAMHPKLKIVARGSSLKVLGANNWTIRKIFLYQASLLIGKAMLWGNVIGLGIYFIQKYLKVIKLDPEIYFVDYAPVELIPWQFVALNICVGVAILAILIIPSYLIAKISPAKSIKFE